MTSPSTIQKTCSNLYICTYIVDPNHFYICDKSAFQNGIIKRVETKIEKYLTENKNIYRGEDVPVVKACVAYFHKGKFIRCEIKAVININSECYVLFAMDYGFQFHVFGSINMYKLPEYFKFLPSPIICVGLDILPAVRCLNYGTFVNAPQHHHEWTEDALIRFRKYFDNAIIVNFEHTLQDLKFNDTMIGTMLIVKESTGKAVSLGTRMVNAGNAIQAVDAADFLKHARTINSANMDFLNDRPGIFDLPSFEWYFQRATKTLKDVRKKMINSEWSKEEKQNTRKVLSWMYRNEICNPGVPEYEDLNEEEDLFELDIEIDEGSKNYKEIPHMTVDMQKTQNQVEIQPSVEAQKPLKRFWNDSTTFMPGGYQISTHLQNLPRFVLFPENGTSEEVGSNQQESWGDDGGTGEGLEWPDSD